jgi:hypothetical protein
LLLPRTASAAKRHVKGWPDRLRDHPAGIAGDADYFVGLCLRPFDADPHVASDGVFTWKVLLCDRFADDGEASVVETLVIAEIAAANKGNLERGEVTGIDGAAKKIDPLAFRKGRVFND